jgi:hypothetical protein
LVSLVLMHDCHNHVACLWHHVNVCVNVLFTLTARSACE